MLTSCRSGVHWALCFTRFTQKLNKKNSVTHQKCTKTMKITLTIIHETSEACRLEQHRSAG